MDRICIMMSYIAMAQKGFVQTNPHAPFSPLLTCRVGERTCGFRLLTAHFGERRDRLPRPEPEHAHGVYHIVLFTEGTNHFLLNGKPVPSTPGGLVLTHPGESHTFAPCDPGTTQYHEITFELIGGNRPLEVPFEELLAAYAGVPLRRLSVPIQLRPGQQRSLVSQYARLLDRLEERGPLAEFHLGRLLLDVFTFLITELYLPSGTDEATVPNPLEIAKEYIATHYTRTVNLSDLARRANYSPSHFCRAFKVAHGISPIAYQLRQRIAAAQRLLAVSSLRCKEIAGRLGFADSYCFSKAFRKITRQSPTRWRAIQNAQENNDMKALKCQALRPRKVNI